MCPLEAVFPQAGRKEEVRKIESSGKIPYTVAGFAGGGCVGAH